MSTDWVKNKDSELVQQVQEIETKIVATPALFGLLPADGTAYTPLVTDYVDKVAIVADVATRTPVAVFEKDTAKAVVVAATRSIGRRVKANPAVTDANKLSLGLRLDPAENTPVPPPTSQPVLTFMGIVNDFGIVTRAVDLLSGKRAKPAGVAGTLYYSFVGENPPADIEQWRHEGVSGKSQFVCGMNPADAGKLITIRARYFNSKGEVGPLSAPVTAIIPKAEEAAPLTLPMAA